MAIIIGKFNFFFKDNVVRIKVLTPKIGIIESAPETIMLWLKCMGLNPCLKSAVILSFRVFIFILMLPENPIKSYLSFFVFG